MVDLATAATFVVALATAVLALVSYSGVRQNKRQVNMLVRQTMLLRSQQEPIPQVKEFAIAKNSIRITVENAGVGSASSLAIGCYLVLARRVLFTDPGGKKRISDQEVLPKYEGNKIFFARYELETKKTIEKAGKKLYPIPVACQLINEARNSTVLLPHESLTYTLDVTFGLQSKKGDESYYPTFDSLVELLKENGVHCFSVDLDLVGKNASEDRIQPQDLSKFVVDLLRHKTLEDAYLDKTIPGYEPMDPMEIARTVPLSLEMYLQMKSQVNYPKYFEEGKIW